MKIYLLSLGSEGEYTPIGVVTDKKKVEELQKVYEGCIWGTMFVEEYDTDVLDLLPEGHKIYEVSKEKAESEFFIWEDIDTKGIEINKPFVNSYKEFVVHVYARNKEHAADVAGKIYDKYIKNNPDAWKN